MRIVYNNITGHRIGELLKVWQGSAGKKQFVGWNPGGYGWDFWPDDCDFFCGMGKVYNTIKETKIAIEKWYREKGTNLQVSVKEV